MESVKLKSLKSVKWVSLSQIAPKIITPFISLLLLNVFKPEDYGIVGICTAFINFFNMLQGFGFADYVIRMENEEEIKIYTTYFLNLTVSLSLFLILLFLAPLIAFIYSENKLIYYLPLLSINLIINSIGFIPYTLLRKRMEFKKLFFVNFIPLIVPIIITLPLGYLRFGPWAIIIGQIIHTLLTNIYYLRKINWSFKIKYDKNLIKEIFNFGKFVSIERFQEYIYENIDVFIIGFFLDLKLLGIYILAKSWSLIIFSMTTTTITGIIYPAFQKFKGDLDKIRRNFLEVEKRIYFLNIPILIIISFNSVNLFPIIFPEKWVDAAVILSIIIIGDGIAKSFSLQRDIFKLIKKPDIYPKAFIINLLFTILVYPIFAKFGLIEFAIVKVINDLLYTLIQYYLSKREFNFTNKDFFSLLKPVLISGFLMAIINLLIIKLFSFNIIIIIFTIIIVFLAYILSFLFLDREGFFEIYKEGKIILGINL